MHCFSLFFTECKAFSCIHWCFNDLSFIFILHTPFYHQKFVILILCNFNMSNCSCWILYIVNCKLNYIWLFTMKQNKEIEKITIWLSQGTSIQSAEKYFFEIFFSPYQFLLNTCNFWPPNESLCNANIEKGKEQSVYGQYMQL